MLTVQVSKYWKNMQILYNENINKALRILFEGKIKLKLIFLI
jgi:hypothetical protein